MSAADLRRLQAHVATLYVDPKIQRYLIDLGLATRRKAEIALGISPRGLLEWQRLARGLAHLRGRDYVVPSDVRELAEPVLSLRLAGDFSSHADIIRQILDSVEVPVFEGRR